MRQYTKPETYERAPEQKKVQGAAVKVVQALQREFGLIAGQKNAIPYQTKPIQAVSEFDEDKLLQGKFEPIQQKPNNTGLPSTLKSGVESMSGLSMDDVKVHYNSDKPAQIQAHAYTQGTDIHVASGQEKHLAHEAWHVVQQKQGCVQATMQMQGMNINNDKGLEYEADVMGGKLYQMKGLVGHAGGGGAGRVVQMFQPEDWPRTYVYTNRSALRHDLRVGEIQEILYNRFAEVVLGRHRMNIGTQGGYIMYECRIHNNRNMRWHISVFHAHDVYP